MSEENVTSEVEVTDTPAISHEDYLELVAMRQSILELKAQKADVLEFVNVAQQYAARLQQAQEQLNLLNDGINENTQALQDKMKAVVEPLGISGEFTITDTEPHYVVSNANAPAPVGEEVEA